MADFKIRPTVNGTNVLLTGEALAAAYATVAEDGTARTQRSTLNFSTGLDAVDNSGSSRTDVTVDLSELSHNNLGSLTTGDPHTQYQLESEKAAANGYASLNASTLVPLAQLGSGTPAAGKYVDGAAGVWTTLPTTTVPRYFTFFYGSTLAVTTGVGRDIVMDAGTITDVRAAINTAPTGAAVNLSVKRNGTQFTTLSISAGANSGSVGSLSQAVLAGDYITVDITQIGSTVAGSDLVVKVRAA